MKPLHLNSWLVRMACLSVVAGCNPKPDGRVICDCVDTSTPTDTGDPRILPVAHCAVDTHERHLSDASFTFADDGSLSEDGRDIVGFEWTLDMAPDTSVAALTTRTGQSTVLVPDVVGVYAISLTVMNDLGLRSAEPCVLTVEVVHDE